MKKINHFFIIIFISIIFNGCICLTCTGNGTCYGKGKCTGVGICKNGYGKCTKIPFTDKPFYATCEGKGSCDGEMSCDGDITKGENGISYCNGIMKCKGEGSCQGNGVCSGIGSCDGDLSNCTGDGTCQSPLGLCAGLPGVTYDSDIMLEEQLKSHKLSK